MRRLAFGFVALAALGACSQPPAAPAAPEKPALSATLPTDAPAGAYKLDNTHASITWKVMHMGMSNYTARFTKWDSELNFDPTDPAKNSVNVTIDAKSVRTDYPYAKTKAPWGGMEDFDAKISSDPTMLNAKKFPTITFKSTGVERTGEKTAKVTGDLTMLGVTKPITIDATFNGGMKEHPMLKAGAIGFSGVGTIKRSDFGFTAGAPFVGDDVQILIEAEYLQAPPTAAAPAK
ncbi:MAG: YceI family protein [Caulobacterales bacterium]